MVRAPCCEKMGLKKGPWTPEEDQILISHIQKLGHGNWRALPKQAGLLRCGKSCRLRWINYLRPDIKRGNFSREEEDTIIKLHEMLGNRWSAIAARLPGRTDNEIKNVWHTHLKKRLNKNNVVNPRQTKRKQPKSEINNVINKSESVTISNHQLPAIPGGLSPEYAEQMSPQPSSSSSDVSSATDASVITAETTSFTTVNNIENMDSFQDFHEIDESFWSEERKVIENSSMTPSENFVGFTDPCQLQQFPLDSIMEPYGHSTNIIDDSMEFWYDLFIKSGGKQDLL